MFGLAALGAIAVGIGAAEIQQRYGYAIKAAITGYDDPAIAVCEFAIQRKAKRILPNFRRTAARMDGAIVTIAYETSALNTRPTVNEERCEFEIHASGKIHLNEVMPENVAACMGRDWQTLRASGPTGIAEAEQCAKALTAHMGTLVDALTLIHMPLSELQIYPIEPEDTWLDVKPDPVKLRDECQKNRRDLTAALARSEPAHALTNLVDDCVKGGYLDR